MRSSDPRRLFAAILIGATVAAAMPVVLSPSDAEAQSSVKVRRSAKGDTIRVREITIDDEGIRIIGSGKDIQVPAVPTPPDVRIDVPGVDIRVDGDDVHVIDLDHPDSVRRVYVRSHGEAEIVQFFRDVRIRKGDRVGPVVALFGSIHNDGMISGDCVSILGSITQGDSAVILGDAVTVGGAVREGGAASRIDGQTVSIGFLPSIGDFGFPSMSLMLIFGILSFLLFVGLAALAGRLFPDRLIRMAETISRRTLLSLTLGVLSVPLAFMLGLLLLVTVIGIPLAFLMPFLFVLAAFLGYVAAAYLLGAKLLGRKLSPEAGILAPVAAGTSFVTLFYLIGVPLTALEGVGRVIGVGFLVLWVVIGTVCWMLGLGALLLSRLGQEDRSRDSSQWVGGSRTGTPSTPPATPSGGTSFATPIPPPPPVG
ncbi:MAG: hypothetical protein ACREOU_03760 [Candidatus Eiseniibacteriota bacterium]